MRDRFAAANDCVVLASVFNTVEKISEVSSRIGGSDVRHVIRFPQRLSVRATLPG